MAIKKTNVPAKAQKKRTKKSARKKKIIAKNREKTKFQKKVSKVIREYKKGKLKSGKGKKRVSNPKQAIAIALSEARKVTGKKRRKK
jgi:hypothetical protein